MTPHAARTWALGLVLGQAACYGQLPPPRTASLRVAADPPSTTVYVDGEYFGSARLLGRQPKPLRIGKRLVTLTAPGYFPHDVELDLPAGETTVRMTLLPIPP